MKNTETTTAQTPDQKGQPLIVVTGADGEIGERLTEALQEDFRVVACAETIPAMRSPRVDYVEMSQADTVSVQSALHQIRRHHGDCIFSVIDLSGYRDSSVLTGPPIQPPPEESARRLMTGLLDFHVKQVVYVSSMSVMQPAGLGTTVCEESPTVSDATAPDSRLEAESVVEELAGAASTVILRTGDVYDSRGLSDRLARQIARIAEKQLASYVYPGDVDAGQCRIHTDDFADCVQRAIRRAGNLQQREMFLVTEPDILSYAELQELLGQMIHGVAWPAVRIPHFVARAGVWLADHMQSTESKERNLRWPLHQLNQHYAANVSRAETLLEWSPAHDIRVELSRIVAEFREDPQRWYAVHNIPLPADPDSLAPVAAPESAATAVGAS